MELLSLRMSVRFITALCLLNQLHISSSSPITDQDLGQIRQFAQAAMAKGRQLLRFNSPPAQDSQGSFSHYYGRYIPSNSIQHPVLTQVVPFNPQQQQKKPEFHTLTAAAPAGVAVQAPIQNQILPSPGTPQLITTTQDPFNTFEEHMFLSNKPSVPINSQNHFYHHSPPPTHSSPFNHISFGPFHFFRNKNPPPAPPPPRQPPAARIRHNQQLQAVMSQQHIQSVAHQTRLQQHQQSHINNLFSGGKPFFVKHHGKTQPQHIERPVGPNFIPQNRPDDLSIMAPHLQPQEFTFTQMPGIKEPMSVGPENNPFQLPVRFEQVQQMPYAFPVQPTPLHLAMVVQSQEFPQYHFNPNTNFQTVVQPPEEGGVTDKNSANEQKQQQQEQQQQQSSDSNPQNVKSGAPSQGDSSVAEFIAEDGDQNVRNGIGDVIFESVRHTQQQEQQREESVTSLPPLPSSSSSPFSQQQGQQQGDIYLAPLVYSQELFPTPSSVDASSSVFTVPSTKQPGTSSPTRRPENLSTTTQHSQSQHIPIEYFTKAKAVDKLNKNVHPVTSTTSFSSSKSVSTSVVQSSPNGPTKLKRLRKVKVPRQQQESSSEKAKNKSAEE